MCVYVCVHVPTFLTRYLCVNASLYVSVCMHVLCVYISRRVGVVTESVLQIEKRESAKE